jgi:wyosine [tRNA(Phe)-imidazoG37] synthetase (radical SAM superfamily)
MILFDEVIFGPVLSRRLGISLGINLLTVNSKICTFNCIYCECGWTQSTNLNPDEIPTASQVKELLEKKLAGMSSKKMKLDSITFAGNGEPTLHPEFDDIIDITIELRNIYYPQAKITVLSNASLLNNDKIINALKKVDNNMLKLDTGVEETFHLINKSRVKISLKEIIENIKKFNNDFIIQTLFVRAEIDGKKIDNTTDVEIDNWLRLLKEINPRKLVIYPISRIPADRSVMKISKHELDNISEKARHEGFITEVFY